MLSSAEILTEILEKYPFVEIAELKNATDNQLMAMSSKAGDNIFTQYGIAKKWEERERKERAKRFFQKNR
ncbi:hypothetical protein BLM37_04365 [Candidatus Gracilibacteria bacterium GN02-873]|nr:hypothetical protein BLM37_04365 [Candidatus Gracilibacteria bacterium GN02-873]